MTLGSTTLNWHPESYLYVYSYLFGNEMETILRMRYDLRGGSAATRTFYALYTILPHSSWYFKHGTIPADWYSSTSTEGWNEGNWGTFPSSSNQIQLYKRLFSVSDISNILGFVLSIKFKYACIVYLNGHEAYRKGLSDATITTSSYADNSYSLDIYRQVSLPIKSVLSGNTPAVNYIQQGLNSIAIGLVAKLAHLTIANFDCALRLMSEGAEPRVFDYLVTSSGIDGQPTSILSHYYDYSIHLSNCGDNYLNIAFNNDRHEWFNSVTLKLHHTQNDQQPHEFVLKARSGNDDDWTTLITISNLSWSQIDETRTISFANSIAYHEYRFESFATGNYSNCWWKLNTLFLNSIDATMTIPELAYASVVIFKDIIMDRLYPNSEYYYNFQASPALPDGITLDPNSGVISGTAKNEMENTTYTVTANKLTGGTSTAIFSITIESCTGGRGLISLIVHTDKLPEQSSYKLYEGSGTSGLIVKSNDHFELPNFVNYLDFCLESGIYTLELFDSASDGWENPAGYYLAIDKGEMIFEMGQVPSGVASVITMFSSYLPFQMEYSEWKISYEYVENWNTVNFDDSEWVSKKPNEIGSNERITTHLRSEVDLPDVDNYQVLNIRVKYMGGVAAYFNGNIVARFNLDDIFNSESLPISENGEPKFSKFHVILDTVGG